MNAQAIHHLGIVFVSLRSDQYAFAVSAVIALIIRTIELETYHRFIRGVADDVEVVDTLFNKPWTKDLRQNYEGSLIEATIIVGGVELSDDPLAEFGNIDSPLLTRYKNLLEEGESHRDFNHAKNVIQRVQNFIAPGPSYVGFGYSIQRIELISPSLIE